MMNFEDYTDIFEPYAKLIEIEICGERYEVPENNSVLRCFQFLAMESISRGDFCWNGSCANCQIWLEENGKETSALACRTEIREKMKIVRTSAEMNLNEDE